MLQNYPNQTSKQKRDTEDGQGFNACPCSSQKILTGKTQYSKANCSRDHSEKKPSVDHTVPSFTDYTMTTDQTELANS